MDDRASEKTYSTKNGALKIEWILDIIGFFFQEGKSYYRN